MEFSTRSIHNLIRDQTGKRVSKSAANQLGEVLEQFAGDVAEEAIALAKDDGYQTVQKKHIKQALQS